MEKMNRRRFIRAGIAGGVAGLAVAGGLSVIGHSSSSRTLVDTVKLGKTGLKVSRIAMGTGTLGGGKQSNQTKLGMDAFVKLAHHAYDKGIRFYEMADMYGSHPYVGEVLKTLPREKVTLLTKFWASPNPAEQTEPTQNILDHMRKEVGTDYFDIVLLHCVMEKNWKETLKYHIDGLSKAKQDGIVKAVGASFHGFEALEEAIDFPWADVLQVRVNPFGSHMDGTPEAVNQLLERAKKNGKGIIGMKIFAEGSRISDADREESLQYALTKANIHCMTLGMESEAQMDDAITRVMRLV